MGLMSLQILVVGEFRGDARRNLSGVCSRWRPLVLVLHRFFIAISRAVVNHDDGAGSVLDPLVWSAGSAPKRRRVAVRNRAFLLGPPDLWVGAWISVAATPFSCRDIEVWPFTVGMLVKWVSFLSSLHWPAGECDLGVGGVSNVELLILYELWAGERLELEKSVPRYRSRFLGALFRGACCLVVLVVLFLVILVLITVGFGTLGGSGVVTVLLPGPVSPLLLIFWTSFGSCLVILTGLLLLYWLVTYLFGIVIPGLLGNCPLGDFLIGVVFVIWLLIVVARFLGCDRFGGDLFPPPVGRAGDSFDDRVLGDVKRIRKHQHTLHEFAFAGELAGEARCRPEPCTERYFVNKLHPSRARDVHQGSGALTLQRPTVKKGQVGGSALRFGRPCDYAATSSGTSSSMSCARSSSSTEWWTLLLCVCRDR